MPLQNRVDPSGQVRAVSARGMFTGNRGIIHDPDTRTLTGRRWTTKAWIMCDCSPGGRSRDVFGRNGRGGSAGWTNLFFLDEVTALAAGHRPCFGCLRAQASAFANYFSSARNRSLMRVAEIDGLLHRQRLATGAGPVSIEPHALSELPDGAIIRAGDRYFARKGGAFLEWSFSGYRPSPPPSQTAFLVTPTSTLAAFGQGYQPVWHPTA
jgi:hypothetical protein